MNKLCQQGTITLMEIAVTGTRFLVLQTCYIWGEGQQYKDTKESKFQGCMFIFNFFVSIIDRGKKECHKSSVNTLTQDLEFCLAQHFLFVSVDQTVKLRIFLL